jgi:hypothetical protein
LRRLTIGLGALAAFLVLAWPAQAGPGRVSGIVVGKHGQRLVLTVGTGSGLTVRAPVGGVRLGDRLSFQTARIADGTMKAAKLRVLGHVRVAKIRGVVVRDLRSATLVAAGHSVIRIGHRPIRALASANHEKLRSGLVGEFRVRIDDDDLFEAAPVLQLGQTANVRIEGSVVSVSPLVVSAEGLPLTITVPAGTTLPAGLAAGMRIELIAAVTVGGNNTFTLVAVDEVENENVNNVVVPNREVEVTGTVVTSTPTQITVASGGTSFTFNASAGTTLPTLPTGTLVEVRGFSQNGTLTLDRLKVEDEDNDAGNGDDHGGSGSGRGGSDDGGGDHGGGGHGGSGH